MATDTSGGGNTFLAFLVGGLLVVVIGFGIVMFGGGHFLPHSSGPPSVNLSVKAPGK